jgi:uncharacterized protein (TIGR02453 family)
MATRHFGPELYAFLRDLKAHNDREWFAEHKARYVRDVQDPMLQFIRDLAPRMKAISPRVVVDARRMGGSTFRIHRDTRFSADKSPFKTGIAARFLHDRKDAPGRPGFYMHLSPDRSVAGGGIYHADTAALRLIRTAIDAAPDDWRAAVRGLDVEGETLKRVPAGFKPDHPLAEALKRKDHVVMQAFTPEQVTAPGFIDVFVTACERIAPLAAFLSRALGLRW